MLMNGSTLSSKKELIQSHVQMPKCILKCFEAKGKFFYYDIVKNYVGTDGKAHSFNTKFGFYSKETEDFLSGFVETPFGKIKEDILKNSWDSQGTIDSCFEAKAKLFVYALSSRNPDSIQRIANLFFIPEGLTSQESHELGLMIGLASLTLDNPLNEYGVTVAVNRTTIPFVLPMCGLYFVKYNGFEHAVFPVLPGKAIVFIEEAGKSTIIHDGIVHPYLISDPQFIESLNKCAVKTQCAIGNGYVVSPDKDALENALGNKLSSNSATSCREEKRNGPL